MKIKNFIIDSDGVFTDGSFYYSREGKIMKKFGSDDADALSILENFINIVVISGDKRGFAITKKRIAEDMGLKLFKVSTFQRIEWIGKHYNPMEVIYMGDGIFDSLVFKKVAYSIAPANAFESTKKLANFVTKNKGGEGAVAEATVHILKKLFKVDFETLISKKIEKAGAWSSEK